jgi:hypothetical protein
MLQCQPHYGGVLVQAVWHKALLDRTTQHYGVDGMNQQYSCHLCGEGLTAGSAVCSVVQQWLLGVL